ncbi:allograft inflammatory factor 1-like, partial [Orcinus orca]|uniref:allograft inflammatory factor 1-like n=1 Tax=Orcinus orca TaxID=9733 RepID=UPI0021112E2C
SRRHTPRSLDQAPAPPLRPFAVVAKPRAGRSPVLTTSVALGNRLQGGKALGLLKARQERRPAEINRELLCDQRYSDEENLPEKLAAFKEKYLEFDLNSEGEIELMSLKRMMEKRGVPKTHLEMKKMISEVAGAVSDTTSYGDFVNMMLGKRSAVPKLVMMFEGKANESGPKPAGPLQRGVASLPGGPPWACPALPTRLPPSRSHCPS